MSEWLCALVVVGGLIALIVAIARGKRQQLRPFSRCPACGEPSDKFRHECGACGLPLDSRRALDLYHVRVAAREIRELRTRGHLDDDTADTVLDQLHTRARELQGLPARRTGSPPRARPVARPATEPPFVPHPTELPAAPVPEPRPELPTPEPAAAARLTAAHDPTRDPNPPREPLLPGLGSSPFPSREAAEPVSPPPPELPRRRLSGFLEEHNILWGELVGGLLIVGCSIALVVTLRETLETIPYFRFLLSAAVTLALFGAGQYTLHRWKLSGTSRGMLVISLLLAPLTLLLLAPPFTEGVSGPADIAVKLAAVAVFVGVVRTGGRDLIGTEHLPGPVDRRWLLVLAVVGATATQLLPEGPAARWLPLLCFVVACGATLGGLSWYYPGRPDEPISEKRGTALLMFVGLAGFALLAAWGLFLARSPAEVATRLASLAIPLALAGVPVVEAGVLIHRRVTSSPGLRTLGTAVALAGFVMMTSALAIAWPDPHAVTLVALAAGAFLTWLAFRERLPWMQAGAIPLLGLAVAVGVHLLMGTWPGGTVEGRAWLRPWPGRTGTGAAESGAALVGFALVLGLAAELLARRGSIQATAYALGAVGIGIAGLLFVSWEGTEQPALAAGAHAASAVGLLLGNPRWQRRAVAHGALYLSLVGSLWGLWWLAPRMPERWGLALAVESLALAGAAVALRGTHRPATSLLRRAARDVSFAAWVLAVVLAATSGTLATEWHTGSLFALALSGIALARLTGWPVLTWVGASAALLGFVHLFAFTLDTRPTQLAVESGILLHATLTAFAAILCQRQGRVFGDPLRWSARLSSVFAVPLLFLPPTGHAIPAAGLALWLGGLWLGFVLLWRERGGFSAFQGAITLAALLAAFGWIELQPWWKETRLGLNDPRALQTFGLALASLSLVWVIVRRTMNGSPVARELWVENTLSVDRIVLGATVALFVSLTVIAAVPGVRAELTPAGWPLPVIVPLELSHAFGPGAWLVLAILTLAGTLAWRLTTLPGDTNPHVIGLAFLFLATPVVWAGVHTADIATASALRWGLATAFVIGSAAVAFRVPLIRLADGAGFPIQPTPALRPVLLALLAVAAGVVVLLSAQVAELGLSRLKASGPSEASVFTQMGTMVSNLVPLALVVLGLGGTATRERSSGYALSGGLVFVATFTAGYALAVITAGKPLDGTEQVRVMLVTAASAALWSLAWLAAKRRVPGGIPLTLQTCLAFGAMGLLCLVPAARLIVVPQEVLPETFDPLGQFGWAALAVVAAAGFWHARRAWPDGVSVPLAVAGGFAGVLLAVAIRGWDEPGKWLSFHTLVLSWAAVGLALGATLRRDAVSGWLAGFAALLIFCALRGGWQDPWRPWLPSGLALGAAVLLGNLALRSRLVPFVVLSCVAVDLAAIFVWIAWGTDSGTSFLLANAAGVGAATVGWTLVRHWLASRGEATGWLQVPEFATVAGLVLLALGLLPAFERGPTEPTGLAWGATIAVALACAAGLWDRASVVARPGLFACGALAVLLVVIGAEPRPVADVPATATALASYTLATAWLALAATQRKQPVLRIPERGNLVLLFVGQAIVAGVVLLFAIYTGLTAPELGDRMLAPTAVALLGCASAVLVQVVPDAARGALRTTVTALGVGVLGAVALSAPHPLDQFAWLHRTGWLFVALAASALAGSEAAARMHENWRGATRSVVGWCAAIAFAVLCVNLLQQVPVFDPVAKRTPLVREAALAMIGGIAGLMYLGLRFALKPERDPFALPTMRRTGYVYAAEVLLVLLFTQVRFNVPELFLGEVSKWWTFAVMALAYVGIGLGELFERKKIDVLAVPLRRTGVLLPLIPLIAFWAKPPGFVSEFARDTAPGLGPMLRSLEALPQHFDTYAWLWALAAGVYGLVALSRKSFGWALLAALATNAAMWSVLAHTGVPFFVHPQAWVIPLALIILVSEHVNRHRLSPDVSSLMRYSGIAMIYVASTADMFIAGVGGSVWLPVVLAVLCVLGVIAGMLLRVRAFIFLGVGFLLLDVFSMIWHAAVNLQQTWVWYASGIVLGVAVLALFAYLEKRRTHAKEPERDSE